MGKGYAEGSAVEERQAALERGDDLSAAFDPGRGAVYGSTEDEPGIERVAAALEIDGLIAPGTDWPVGVGARIAERLRLAHPITPATAVLATNKLRKRQRSMPRFSTLERARLRYKNAAGWVHIRPRVLGVPPGGR